MIKIMKNLHFDNGKEKNMRKKQVFNLSWFLGQLVLVDQGDTHVHQYNAYTYQ